MADAISKFPLFLAFVYFLFFQNLGKIKAEKVCKVQRQDLQWVGEHGSPTDSRKQRSDQLQREQKHPPTVHTVNPPILGQMLSINVSHND